LSWMYNLFKPKTFRLAATLTTKSQLTFKDLI